LTWFRREQEMHWFDLFGPQAVAPATEIVQQFLS
jgi:tRNA A37 N6-isopentenylltransferase MiaA